MTVETPMDVTDPEVAASTLTPGTTFLRENEGGGFDVCLVTAPAPDAAGHVPYVRLADGATFDLPPDELTVPFPYQAVPAGTAAGDQAEGPS